MSREALLIIDVQNDFCPGGSLPVYGGDKVVEPLNKMIYLAASRNWPVIFSRDWHPAKTSHFDKWPVHCVQDTEGAQFHPSLKVDGVFGDRASGIYRVSDLEIFSKGMGESEDAYSAFDARNVAGVGLEEYLTKMGVVELFIGGLATDYCVKASALDSVKRLFRTNLLTDAIAAVNLKSGDEEEAIKEMVKAGVRLTNIHKVTEKYLEDW